MTATRHTNDPPPRPHVVVIGGGVAGMSAAVRLDAAGADVTVLEAERRLGGCIRTVPFAGEHVDVGAEAIHTASPEPLKLVAELGLTADLVPAATAPTWLATTGGLRALPAGVGPAGPTRLAPLVAAGLLSPAGLLRAAIEPVLPRTQVTEDTTVGGALGRRFGRQVVERIVDPLLGGLHAGDVDRLAVDAATPRLAAVLGSHRSVVMAMRGRRSATEHGFVTLRGGLGRVLDAAAARLDGNVRTGVTVRAVIATAGGYRVETDAGVLPADGVVVATPTHVASQLLAPLAARIADPLDGVSSASVAVALLAYPASAATRPALAGTGVLVASRSDRLLKAATFLSTKWPHLDSPHVLVRASAGRARDPRIHDLDDDQLVTRLAGELEEVAGLDHTPVDQLVVRWARSMPQLEVGHRGRIRRAREQLAAHPGVALAGASYDGVGISTAVRSGTTAADHVLQRLDRTIGAAR